MTVHHGLRAAAGNAGFSGSYTDPYFDYWWHNYGGYHRGVGSIIWTHSGTPVTGNGDTGWTGQFMSTSHTMGSQNWQSKSVDLSAHLGKWAIFGFIYERPSYWMADHLWDNIRYRDSGGSVNLPYTTNSNIDWSNLWAGYTGQDYNIQNYGLNWPLLTSNRGRRYNLTTNTGRYGRWVLRNTNTPSGTTGQVGTGQGYFVYHESSASMSGYASTDNNNYRFLITRYAYLIGNSQATPILYSP